MACGGGGVGEEGEWKEEEEQGHVCGCIALGLSGLQVEGGGSIDPPG